MDKFDSNEGHTRSRLQHKAREQKQKEKISVHELTINEARQFGDDAVMIDARLFDSQGGGMSPFHLPPHRPGVMISMHASLAKSLGVL